GAGVPVGLVPPERTSAEVPPLPPHERAAASPNAASILNTEARLGGLLSKRAPKEKVLDACRGVTQGPCGIFSFFPASPGPGARLRRSAAARSAPRRPDAARGRVVGAPPRARRPRRGGLRVRHLSPRARAGRRTIRAGARRGLERPVSRAVRVRDEAQHRYPRSLAVAARGALPPAPAPRRRCPQLARPGRRARPFRAGEVQRGVLRGRALPRPPLHAKAQDPPFALVRPRRAARRRARATRPPLASVARLPHARYPPQRTARQERRALARRVSLRRGARHQPDPGA